MKTNTNNAFLQFIEDLIQKNPLITDKQTASYFLKRAGEGKISKEEDPYSHFCAYFIAYDPKLKKVFLGHHIKSGLWLFNGGHTDKGELPFETIQREISEEWGIKVGLNNAKEPLLLSITPIQQNPAGRLCREHVEFCYFIPLDSKSFHPLKEKLDMEFYETRWMTIKEAEALIGDPTTIKCLNLIKTLS